MVRNALTAVLLAGFVALGATAADAKKNLAKPTNELKNWRLELHETAKADIALDGNAIVVTIKEVTGTDWHVQPIQTGIDLKDGKDYVYTFKAKASSDRTIPVNAGIDQEDWHPVGFADNAEMTTEWKDFSYEFKAENTVKEKNRLCFLIGGDKGKVWIKDVVLSEK